MMNEREFSGLCRKFCEKLAAKGEVAELVRTYPYFQIARLMATYGTVRTRERADLAFRMDDRVFLYHFMSGMLRLAAAEEAQSSLEAATMEIPREVHGENGRSALQVLNEMLEKYRNKPSKPVPMPADVPEDEVYEYLGKSSNMERTNFVSETLAEIYLEQKEYDRAMKVYRVLMERQPEKAEHYAAALERVRSLKNPVA